MDPWEKRRLRLLYELHRRGDGVLELAAAALDIDPTGPIYNHLKQELLNNQEMVLVVIPEGPYPDQEFYRTTPKGEQTLREAGDEIFSDN